MKVKIEIEATAQEMRDFFGLPDLRPLHQELLKDLPEQLRSGAAGFDPVSLMKPLFPAQMQSMESLQRAFWEAFQHAADDPQPSSNDTDTDTDTDTAPNTDDSASGKRRRPRSKSTG